VTYYPNKRKMTRKHFKQLILPGIKIIQLTAKKSIQDTSHLQCGVAGVFLAGKPAQHLAKCAIKLVLWTLVTPNVSNLSGTDVRMLPPLRDLFQIIIRDNFI
jgi:hypothetical protein